MQNAVWTSHTFEQAQTAVENQLLDEQWRDEVHTPSIPAFFQPRTSGQPMLDHPLARFHESGLAAHTAALAPTAIFAAARDGAGGASLWSESCPRYTLSVEDPGMGCTAGYTFIPVDPKAMSVQVSKDGSLVRLHTGQLPCVIVKCDSPQEASVLDHVDFVKDGKCDPRELWRDIRLSDSEFWQDGIQAKLDNESGDKEESIVAIFSRLGGDNALSGKAYCHWTPLPSGTGTPCRCDELRKDNSKVGVRNNPCMRDLMFGGPDYLEERFCVAPRYVLTSSNGSTETGSSDQASSGVSTA